ncbi:DNA-binding transcriptional MerR regulator [Spinactinospora alkalitolerans]|uniref:DNA-binding transcriptional MerR regulator n=1 Tax=Spinactinospora alkalitolerans TaxID=687207 RepID=A0A852TXF0_9ACTN|nr:MerR family transcriptional regulator [Spinactinospora alkalitolerans]NYE47503.1 DNA-binding transcriptional MerR regulator [Spinactinospora alkalitolerans]
MSREEKGLRPIDLARTAGVSTQQIRNYEDAGILPPAPRTPAGYRRFGAGHRRALVTYRALAKGYGPGTAQAIMRAVHDGDLPLALTLVDAGHAALHEQRLSLQAASEALEAIAEQTPDTSASARPGMRVGEVAAHLGVRASALRVWESSGLLAPERDPGTGYRRFSSTDVRDARMINVLRQSRYPLPQIRPILDGLRRTGGSDALRAAITQRQAALTQRAAAMLEGSGRLHHYVTDEEPPSEASRHSRTPASALPDRADRAPS